MSETSRCHVPVLIVGAGPTGLTLASALLRHGIEAKVIEKKKGLSRYTKASNLMLRSQEVLGALDLHMPLEEIGGPMRGIVYEVHGHSLGFRSMLQPDTPYPGVLLCGQNRLEEMLAGFLAKSGLAIDFETELLDARQEGDRVVARVRGAHGESELSCDYLVGCDGASGPTRRFTRWNFTPHRTGVAVRQVDCRLEWSRSMTQDQMWIFYFTHGFMAVVPLPGGMYRIATHEPVANLPSDRPGLAEMEARLRRVTGDASCRLTDLDWSTHTDLAMGIADGLRDGRILLAGDSGNPILPNGGQGMNVGISDAFNLGWKLASVLRGAPDALLDTYATERLTLRAALEKFQWKSLEYTTLKTPAWLRWTMPRVLEAALNRGGEAALARVFSQLGEGTRGSALTLELAGREGLQAGDRVPDTEISMRRQPLRLFDVIYTGGWSLLSFTGLEARANPSQARGALDAFAHAGIARYRVSARHHSEEGPEDIPDLDQSVHRAFRITRPLVYLIRPDGYVAARARPEDIAKLVAYAARWVKPGALTARPLKPVFARPASPAGHSSAVP